VLIRAPRIRAAILGGRVNTLTDLGTVRALLGAPLAASRCCETFRPARPCAGMLVGNLTAVLAGANPSSCCIPVQPHKDSVIPVTLEKDGYFFFRIEAACKRCRIHHLLFDTDFHGWNGYICHDSAERGSRFPIPGSNDMYHPVPEVEPLVPY
jgi:hypothetical protein